MPRKQLTGPLDLKLNTVERELVMVSLREQQAVMEAAERAFAQARTETDRMSARIVHAILRGRRYDRLPADYTSHVDVNGKKLFLRVRPKQIGAEQAEPEVETHEPAPLAPTQPLPPEPIAANPPATEAPSDLPELAETAAMSGVTA